MRTLSRPMFNMGGPIKEGIMHGIREPRQGYADRGLVKQITEQVLKKPYTSTATGVGAATTAKVAADAAKKASLYQRAGSLFSKGIPTDVQIGKGIKNIAQRVGQWRLPSLGVTNPLTFGLPAALTAKYKYTQPEQVEKEYGISRMEKLLASTLPGGDQSYLPLALRSVFGERKIEEPKSILENITMEEGVPGGGDPRMTYTDPDKASDLAKAAKDKRVNELLEIMGYDKAKKGAAYDALIDASQIISQAPGGESLDISRDIIQPAIAATSKRFDKPKEIEEAVRLMQTKADIQKDLTKDETALANEAKRMQIKVAKKTLAGPTLTEAYNAYWEKHGSYPSGDSLANLARTKGVEVESVVDNKTIKSWLKNNKGKDEVDFMELEVKKAKEDKTPITPGVYVVSDRIIIVGVDGTVKSHL